MNFTTNNSLQPLSQNHQQNNPLLESPDRQIKPKSSNNTQFFSSFEILEHLERLDIVKETPREYHCKCPVCGNGGFKIDKPTGKYNHFGCDCDFKDIREAIRPWSEVLEESESTCKTIRPKQYREWVYRDRQGNDLIKVCRSDDGKGNKKIWQQHWDGSQWRKGYGDIKREEIPVYRYQEIQRAIARGEHIVIAEGEDSADAFWSKGWAATTNIGGAGKWLESHTEDLLRAPTIILSPDRDQPGVKHMEEIAHQLPQSTQIKWLYPFPDSPLWRRLPPSQGLDIADWVREGATQKDILAAIEERSRQLNQSINENNKVIQPPRADTGRTTHAGRVSLPDVSLPVEQVLVEEIDRILAENLSEGELNARIITLASNFGRGTKDIWRLYHSRSEELEKTENLETTKEEVNRLLKIQDYQIKMSSYLQPQLAEPLEKLAKYLGVNNATLLTTLLTTSASLLPIDTKLELIKATSFYARPILYSGICAPSGSGKSPAIKAILAPLFELQTEEDTRYYELEEQYRQNLKEYKKSKNSESDEPEAPPPPREYFVTDSTSEAIALIQNNQPNNGFLGYFDELKQLIGQSNSYRGGKGADIEKLLSGRDGSGFKVNRASGKRISCPRSGYSILGGIQPEVLRKQMGDFSDGNGFWARFIWVNQPMQRKPFPDDDVALDISPLLRSLYEFLGTIDNTFVLSPRAKAKFKDWYNYVEERKLQEARPALQAVWSKSQRLVGELALLLHCLTYAIYQQQPPQFVEPEILSAAIRLAKFYIGQVELIHANGEPESSNQPNTYTKLIELSKRKGWITARDAKASIRSYRNKTPSQVRSLFREIESVGYGVTQGVGSKLRWNYKTVDTADPADNSADRVSTEPKTSVNSEISLSNNNVSKKPLTTVDSQKTAETISAQGLQPKKVDMVDQKNAPRSKSPQSKLNQTVDNQINTSINKMSTEIPSNPDEVRDRGGQQLGNNWSTEKPVLESNQAVDEISTESSTLKTVSTAQVLSGGGRVDG